MPELPEVETIRRQLDKVLVGQKIKKIEVRRPKSFPSGAQAVKGRQILAVERRAKMLVIKLSGGLNLLIHLKMTGQLIYDGLGKKAAELPNPHTRVIISLDRGRLFFNDLRIFGWIKVLENQKLKTELEKLPPDVVDPEFTPHLLQNILRSSGQAIKIVLMDQQRVGGIGNIYANEALFCAGIRPERKGVAIKKPELKSLFKCLKQVINQGIKYGGATASDDNYVNAAGQGGKYQEHFLVYEREGERCRRCSALIKKIRLGGRGTYFCPKCQK
jgi:formamidopyrimidine-DNA glycosylase